MAREPRYARSDRPSGEFGDWSTHRGHVKLHVLGRGIVCLIGAVFVLETSFVDRNPSREHYQMRLAEGENGVETTSLAVSTRGTLIATTDTAGRVSLRNETLGCRIGKFADYQGFALSVAFTPDGRFLAIGGFNFGIALWDPEREGSERPELVPLSGVRAMVFSPDGRYLAAASEANGKVVVWDLAERREKMILKSHEPVRSLACSPDGRYLAGGERGDRGSVYVWDLETGQRAAGAGRVMGFRLDGRVLCGRGHSGHGRHLRKGRSALGRAIGPVVPGDRGSLVGYDFGRFLAGWSRTGVSGQRRDGPSLERRDG